MLFEVELIINNALLTYVYLITIETCLTPNHLLFGRQSLCSSNSTSTVVPRHFWSIAIVTRFLPSRDSEIKVAIVRIAKINTILKHPVNKLFAVENTYHDIN